MRVLLVEDEKYLSSAIVKLLKQEHFETDAVYNGTDGLDYALINEYDAIIYPLIYFHINPLDIIKE